MKHIIHFTHDNQLDAGIVRRYAEERGYSYQWASIKSEPSKAADAIKYSAMAVIWNGLQHNAPLATRMCRRRGIPVCYIEWGLLPQSATFSVDPSGFCGDSILASDVSWVTDADVENLRKIRKQLQEQHPLQGGNHVLVPLQIENDTQVLYFSPYRSMEEFVADVERMYPSDRIIVRPHPKSPTKRTFARAEVDGAGSFLEAAARARLVIGITSTCLYEAAILGVPVLALGDHPLRSQPRCHHDQVLAGALALRLDRAIGDLGPILDRLRIRPL